VARRSFHGPRSGGFYVCNLRAQSAKDVSSIQIVADAVGRVLRAAARAIYTRQSDYMRRYLEHSEDTTDLASVLRYIASLLTEALPVDDFRSSGAATSSGPIKVLHRSGPACGCHQSALHSNLNPPAAATHCGAPVEGGTEIRLDGHNPPTSLTALLKPLAREKQYTTCGDGSSPRTKLDPGSPWYHIFQVFPCSAGRSV
jgi:hypothetical protein